MSIYLQLRLILALISSEKKKGNITLYMLRENINDFVIFRNFRTKTRVSGDNFWKVCVCTMGWEFFQFGVLKNRYLQILAKIKTVWLKLSWVKLYASTVLSSLGGRYDTGAGRIVSWANFWSTYKLYDITYELHMPTLQTIWHNIIPTPRCQIVRLGS